MVVGFFLSQLPQKTLIFFKRRFYNLHLISIEYQIYPQQPFINKYFKWSMFKILEVKWFYSLNYVQFVVICCGLTLLSTLS